MNGAIAILIRSFGNEINAQILCVKTCFGIAVRPVGPKPCALEIPIIQLRQNSQHQLLEEPALFRCGVCFLAKSIQYRLKFHLPSSQSGTVGQEWLRNGLLQGNLFALPHVMVIRRGPDKQDTNLCIKWYNTRRQPVGRHSHADQPPQDTSHA